MSFLVISDTFRSFKIVHLFKLRNGSKMMKNKQQRKNKRCAKIFWKIPFAYMMKSWKRHQWSISRKNYTAGKSDPLYKAVNMFSNINLLPFKSKLNDCARSWLCPLKIQNLFYFKYLKKKQIFNVVSDFFLFFSL